jgi:micrococcal nuclease
MRVRNVVIGAVAAVVVVGVGAGAYMYLSRDKDDADVVKAEVTGIVSGDTLLVDLDGQSQTVHLLNVIAPTEEGAECLALESSQQLGILAPIGTEVHLEYAKGVEPKDTHGDEVFAGVYLEDGRLLNAEMAGEGLVYADPSGGNTFFWPAQTAQEAARQTQAGLFSPDVPCTIPAQVTAVGDKIELAPTFVSSESSREQLQAQRAELASILTEAQALLTVVDGPQTGAVWGVLRDSDRVQWIAQSHTQATVLQVATSQIDLALAGGTVVGTNHSSLVIPTP